VSEIRLSWEQLTRADNEDYAAYYRRIEGLSEQARKARDTHETFKRRYEIMKPLGADDWEDRIRGLIERFLATEFLIPTCISLTQVCPYRSASVPRSSWRNGAWQRLRTSA
jgi:hypothetical protein